MPNTYGAFAALGCTVAVSWLHRHHRALGVTANEFWAALWAMLAGAVIGAKALFVVLGWEHYARGELHLWEDFGVGFVFTGGLLGAWTVGVAFAWWRRLDFFRGADYFAVAVPLGHAIGRVGCFQVGCCHGHPPHPVQLYEATGLLAIAWQCRRWLRTIDAGARAPGVAFAGYLGLYGILRLALDPLRADGHPERIAGLSWQQAIAVALVLLAVGIATALHRRPRSPRRDAEAA